MYNMSLSMFRPLKNTMKFSIIIIVILTVVTASSLAKTFTRCSLARKMHRLGVPKSELAKWICLAKYESSFRTKAVGATNPNGSKDYGIFQINNKYWCQPAKGSSHNLCQVSCQALLTDNIRMSVNCARKIKSQQGWTAWSAWRSHCSGSLPSIKDCFASRRDIYKMEKI